MCNFSWPRVFETSLVCQRFFEGGEAEAPAESADDEDAAEKAADMAEVPAADAECLRTFCTSLGAALMCSTHVQHSCVLCLKFKGIRPLLLSHFWTPI